LHGLASVAVTDSLSHFGPCGSTAKQEKSVLP
jgi:hypothetical protein